MNLLYNEKQSTRKDQKPRSFSLQYVAEGLVLFVRQVKKGLLHLKLNRPAVDYPFDIAPWIIDAAIGSQDSVSAFVLPFKHVADAEKQGDVNCVSAKLDGKGNVVGRLVLGLPELRGERLAQCISDQEDTIHSQPLGMTGVSGRDPGNRDHESGNATQAKHVDSGQKSSAVVERQTNGQQARQDVGDKR